MRRLTACLCIGLTTMLAGCHSLGLDIFNPNRNNADIPKNAPTAEQLVDYMNRNSERLKTMRCDDLRITAMHGIQSVALDARMVAQQPRDFRMTATFLSKPEVDLGSNQKEFWYWIRRGDRAQVYCPYDDLEAGRVRQMPFPFQPEWVLETMGMSNFGPATRYKLTVEADKLKLTENIKSPQGKPMRKVIVFNRRPTRAPDPQVTDFILVDDETNKEICSATIRQTQVDPNSGGTYPRRMELRWPSENMSLKMYLASSQANVALGENFPAFVRQPLDGIPSFNLAQGQFDGRPTSIQRTGGFSQR